MKKHPPSCIGPDVGPATSELRNLIQGEYGTNTTVFALRCSCGEDRFGVSLPEDGFGLVFIKCAQCGLQRTIFDPSKHGYDGALGNNKGLELGPSSPSCCPKCQLGVLRLATGFQYSGETSILEEEKLDIKPQDLFGWFVLGGQCTSCGGSNILADLECA
ncbi:MAG TPA: hypothetical protein VNN22_00730 [Verrucomicrobiae bacterium]|nr:hypothetical protein [Verrucomicrobiae bacterium]